MESIIYLQRIIGLNTSKMFSHFKKVATGRIVDIF